MVGNSTSENGGLRPVKIITLKELLHLAERAQDDPDEAFSEPAAFALRAIPNVDQEFKEFFRSDVFKKKFRKHLTEIPDEPLRKAADVAWAQQMAVGTTICQRVYPYKKQVKKIEFSGWQKGKALDYGSWSLNACAEALLLSIQTSGKNTKSEKLIDDIATAVDGFGPTDSPKGKDLLKFKERLFRP